MRRLGPATLAVLLATIVAGCAAAATTSAPASLSPSRGASDQPASVVAPTATTSASATSSVAISITVPGPSSLPADSGPALAVFETRLTRLGVTDASSGLSIDASGIHLTGVRPSDLTDDVVRAALTDRGDVTIVGLSGPTYGTSGAVKLPAIGAVLDPSTVTPLADLTGPGASATPTVDASGNRALEITLPSAGAQAVAAYTSGHVGQAIAVLIDGRVFVTPIVQSPITGPDLVIGDGQDGDTRLIDALLASGPLPSPFGR